MTIRVVQWATGAVGLPQLQELIEHPDYELVGVLVYDPAKAGLDAGTLCGLPDTGGVLTTADKEAIFALGADVVIHAASKAYPVETNSEDIRRLLASGSSVISTTSYNHLPTYGADVEAMFVDACLTGGSRFHAAGENPGFMMERLVATVTGLSKHVERIDLYEAVDVSDIASPQMMFDLMGMGRKPEEITVDSPHRRQARYGVSAGAQRYGGGPRHRTRRDTSGRGRQPRPSPPTTFPLPPARSEQELLSGSAFRGSVNGGDVTSWRSTKSGSPHTICRSGICRHRPPRARRSR